MSNGTAPPLVINMQLNEAQCRFCGKWFTNRCGGAIPVCMDTVLVVANDFDGEWGGATACAGCRDQHAKGRWVGEDVPF